MVESASIATLSKAEREAAISKLREESRQNYLLERKNKELDLLRWKIADEEELFRQEKLTDIEIKRLEANKELLKELEKKLLKEEDMDENYQLPESYIDEKGKLDKSKKESLLNSRYTTKEVEKSKQEIVEENKIKASNINVMTIKQKKNEHDLLIEDEIEFLADEIINGDLSLDEINEEIEKNEVFNIYYIY